MTCRVQVEWHLQNGEARETFGSIFYLPDVENPYFGWALGTAANNIVKTMDECKARGRFWDGTYVIDHPEDAE